MLLFTAILLLCLLFLLMSDLIKLLRIKSYIRQKSVKYTTKLQEDLDVATNELKTIKEMKFVDSYKYNILLLRAEAAVKEIKKKLRSEQNISDLKSASAEVMATYCAKGLISLILCVISIRNRYTPVVILHERFNFDPLGGIFSFPTGVANAISVPMWVLSCNVSLNFINNIIRSLLPSNAVGK